MRAVVQRVLEASVSVKDELKGHCINGMLLLIGIHVNDTIENAQKLAEKIINLRIFEDENKKMNLALPDLPQLDDARILVISNFTVYGDVTKSRRPSFTGSAPYNQGLVLFDALVESLRKTGSKVETGVFGAEMKVNLVNDGPVTLILDF